MTRTQLSRFLIAGAMLMIGCEEEVPPPRRVALSQVQKLVEPTKVESPTVNVPKVEPSKVVAAVEMDGGTPSLSKADDASPQSTDELLSEARDSIRSGDFDRALRLAEKSVKRSPNRSAAWNTLGRVQLQRGRRQSAIAAFQRAVELNPKSSYAQNNLGLALIYDGSYEDAAQALEEATELASVEPYMWNNLGMAYEHLDRIEEARACYQKATEMSGGRASANLDRLKGVRTLRTAKAEIVPSDDEH